MNSTRTLKAIILVLSALFAFSVSFNFTNYLDDSETVCVDYSEQPRSKLQLGTIDDITKNYQNGQLISIKSSTHLDDTKAVHFSLDSIDKFIYNIKREVLKNSKNPDQLKLGLRVYFASYPELDPVLTRSIPSDLKDLPVDYSNRLTLVFLPTIKNSNNQIVDFDPSDTDTYDTGLPKLNELDGNDNPIGSSSTIDPTKQVLSLVVKESTARNHGGLHPPYSNDGSFFHQ